MNKNVHSITSETMNILQQYHWPGNIRELENVIERAMVLAVPPSICLSDIPFQFLEKQNAPDNDTLDAIECTHIQQILSRTNWNITRAAEVLDIDRVTLYNKIAKYGLKRPA